MTYKQLAIWRPVVVLAGALAVTVAGCSSAPTAAPGASAADVRATWGAPTAIVSLPDGERWAYSTAPEGRSVRILQFDTGGRLLSNQEGLTMQRVARIANGQSRDEVEALIGPSYWSLRYPFRQDELVHVYRLLDGMTPTCFYVGYDAAGRVSSTGMREEDRPERGMLSLRPC